MLTLISHIRNEALLLPQWIAHHRPMVDAATIIDYASTDESLDIVRTLAPEWRIVRSQNIDFDANDADFEVMQVEWYTPGWKVVLNTTEYMVAPNLRPLLQVAESSNVFGITGEAFLMVDRQQLGLSGLKADRPLLPQLHYGWNERPERRWNRLLHRWRTGAYAVGRHSWQRGPTAESVDLLFAKLVYAPWDDKMLERKLSIGKQVSAHDKVIGNGFHHLRTAEDHRRDFAAAAARSVDLREDALWARLVGAAR